MNSRAAKNIAYVKAGAANLASSPRETEMQKMDKKPKKNKKY